MSDTPVVSEREKRTCHVCRRRRKPEAMEGVASVTDPARGPTTEELRARVLAQTTLCGCHSKCGDDGDTEGPGTCKGLPRMPEPPLVEVVLVSRRAQSDAPAALLLARPCLACNSEQGEPMCDLCQRLEVAEDSAAR